MTVKIAIQTRVEPEVAAALDAIAAANGFGRALSRSDVVRRLILDGVAAHRGATRTGPVARARVR